jgi:hypothetical protein
MIRQATRSIARRRGRHAALLRRRVAVWLAMVALLAQFWGPVAYGARSAVPGDPRYAAFLQVFGPDAPICALAGAAKPGETKSGCRAATRDPFQCPLCQPMYLLDDLIPPLGIASALPSVAHGTPAVATIKPGPAGQFFFHAAARAPPALA